MDEKGFVLGSGARVCVTVHTAHRAVYRQRMTPGNRDFVTAVDGVSMTGRMLDPLVIFKGKEVDVE